MSNGSQFYVNSGLEMVVDPLGPPVVQNQLLSELKKCDHLVQLDWRYAQMVAGASKMPMNMIWVARNQDDLVNDTDLAALKDLTWNEIVKKRYLTSVPGTSTVSDTATSMLEIVRQMNLQRRRFQIMGLHEQVEASEIHLILHLCQAGLLRTDKYRITANRFRRHDRLFEAFGLAVGAFVCASAPFTLGAATTRYERDLQYEYKKNATALFVYVLQQNLGGMNAVELEEDYVARIARLIVVWPDEEGKQRRIGFRRKGKGDDKDDDDGGGNLGNLVLESVAVAQERAEKAHLDVSKLQGELVSKGELWETMIKAGHSDLREFMGERLRENEQRVRDQLARMNDAFKDDLQLRVELKNSAVEQEIRGLKLEIATLGNVVRNLNAGGQAAGEQLDAAKLNELQSKVDGLISGVQGMIQTHMNGYGTQINTEVKSQVDSLRAELARRVVDMEAKVNSSTEGVKSETARLADLIRQGIDGAKKSVLDAVDVKMNTMWMENHDKTLQSVRAFLLEDLKSLQTSVQAAATEIQRLKAKESEMSGSVMGLTVAHEELSTTIGELKTFQDRANASMDEIASLKARISAIEDSRSAAMETDGNELKAQMDAMKTQMDAMKARMDRLVSNPVITNSNSIMRGFTRLNTFETELKEARATLETQGVLIDSMTEAQTTIVDDVMERIREDLPDQLSTTIPSFETTPPEDSSGTKRPRTATGGRTVILEPSPSTKMKQQQFADAVKNSTNAYLQQIDINGQITATVNQVVTVRLMGVKRETVDAGQPTQPPPSDFEDRLKKLEELFLNISSDEATGDPFALQPMRPGDAHFSPPI